MAEVGERLVTVLLTLAVPGMADPEDAAQLAADAATSTALQVVHAAAVEGHLPVPGATVVRTGRDQPWLVVGTTQDSVRLRDLDGHDVQVPWRSVRPDPLDPALLTAGSWIRRSHSSGTLQTGVMTEPAPRRCRSGASR